MLYPIKVNMAIAAMAIKPSIFDGKWRSDMQQLGKSAQLTPQETAIMIVAHGLGINYPTDAEETIGVWRHEGKIDLSKQEIADALTKMGLYI